ncbi:MAG: 2-amino-3,7-dideoxy-D-threo-hept-6-ulosonate synthase [Actinophytocola sp.]|uniref:2-amino-3,7-dideoxy-D-threo-hept-6-ulosonate synthase n=1 Tax=Actinophytocola sp. TaxID=1872138 RepID=UPI003C779A5D
MSTTFLSGKSVRMERLSRPRDGKYLLIPLDHSVSDGPIASAQGFDQLVHAVCAAGADGVVVHKGRARTISPRSLAGRALVVQLSASTAYAPDSNAKTLVGDVEEAVRLGADAVSVHINIGSDTETTQLHDLGTVAAACDNWGVPLLAMMYPRGPRIADPTMPELVSHVVAVATDLGVDIVKTVLTTPPQRMAEIVASTPLPVIVAGGASSTGSVTGFARSAMAAGCGGLAMGRRVFSDADPQGVVRALTAIVHEPASTPAPTHDTEMAGVS